jgi:hypothetical protein
MRRILLDDDLMMLIGPATDGALLEIGILDIEGDDPVVIHAQPLRPKFHRFSDEVTMTRHTDKEIEQAARRFEHLVDTLDPDTAHVESTDDLREIATAAKAVRADDARLREAVLLARARGRSWNHIALALGVSRQAARQRFADKASA